jgi:REP element-mobilizing transposase RayT
MIGSIAMSYDPDKHDRQSIRLRGYDYTQAGAYFITMCALSEARKCPQGCTHDRMCLFGRVEAGRMYLNSLGRIVAEEWERSAAIRTEIQMDTYVVMPNHMHGIVLIAPPDDDRRDVRGYDIRAGMQSAPAVGATGRSPLPDGWDAGPPPKSLGALVAGFKSAATKWINRHRQTPGAPVWQRNYHDRIMRNVREWRRIRGYIATNRAVAPRLELSPMRL